MRPRNLMDPDLISKVGLPVALVVALIAFFARGVWPWMTKQVDTAQSQTSAAIAAMAGLKDNLAQQTEVNRQIVGSLQKILDRDKR